MAGWKAGEPPITLRRVDLEPIEEAKAHIEELSKELGTTPEELVAGYVNDAAEALREAAKCATRHERPDLHLLVVKERAAIEDLLIALGEER